MRFRELDREPFPIEVNEENIALAKEFVFAKWVERHNEREEENRKLAGTIWYRSAPTDLSDSCKFSALFSSVVFGGEIAGNYDHVFTLVDDEVLDLNEDAADVAALDDPHDDDDDFIYSGDFKESISSCIPRVRNWIADFAAELDLRAGSQVKMI